MLAQQVAKKYAMAIFQLALEKNLIDRAWDQFNSLAVYLNKDRTFLDFMSAPQVPDHKKRELIKTAFTNRLDKPLFDFLMVLVKKHRIGFLVDIVEEFDRLVRVEKGIAKATCIMASKITDEERRKLIDNLADKTSLKIELVEKIDKSILGGMIIILHNQIIDGSVRHNINQLRNRLMKLKVH